MTAPGGAIATVYVDVLPRVRDFAHELRQSLRRSSRELRGIDRELEPVTRALALIGKTATGIVPGIRLARASLLSLGGHAVIGGLLSVGGAISSLSGTLGVLPAAGSAAASILGTLTVGLFGVEKALKKFAEEDKFNEKLKDLSANAQATLGVLNEFRDEITAFRDAIQDRLFAGLEDVTRGLLETFLPRLTTHFGRLADQINLAVKDLAAFVQTGETLSDVDTITSNTEVAFQTLRAALIPAATALRDLVTVGSTFLPQIAAEAADVAVQFAAWISQMRATGQLQTFISDGIAAFKQLAAILGNVGRTIVAVLGAAEESGNGLLDTLERLTGKAADFFESARGQNVIKDFLDSAREAAHVLLPVLAALGDLLFNSVIPVLLDVGERVGPAVAQFFDGLGNAIDVAAPGIRAFATGFSQFITAITPVLPLLGQLVAQLGTMVGVLAARLGPVIAQIATAIGNLLLPVLEVLTAIFTFIPEPILKLAVVIGVVVAAIAGLVTVMRGIEAVTKLFAGGLEAITTGALKTQKGVGGLVGFLSGPWGVALGAASIVLGLFLSTTEDSAEEQRRLAGAASDLNDVIREQNGVINENVRLKANEQLESEGALQLAERLGISIDDVTDAYVNQGDALDALRTRLQDVIDAGTSVTAPTGRGGAGQQTVLNEEAKAARDLLILLNSLSGERQKDADAQRRQAEAATNYLGPAGLVNSVIDAQRLLLEEVTNARLRDQQVMLEAINSEIAYFNQLDRTNQELTEGSKTLDINTQEGRDNLSALTQLSAAGATRVQDLIAQGATTEQVNAVLQQNRDQLIGLLTPYFNSADAARQFAIQVGLIPREPINIKASFDSGGAIAAMQAVLSNLLAIKQQVPFISSLPFGSIAALALSVTGRARGGPVAPGQWTWVGEEGPELVRFGSSARVFSADESARMSRDVGELDLMTSRGGVTPRDTTTGVGSYGSSITVDNQIDVQPIVKVYVDGQELMGNVRVELDARDRQLRRLVTTNVGRL